MIAFHGIETAVAQRIPAAQKVVLPGGRRASCRFDFSDTTKYKGLS